MNEPEIDRERARRLKVWAWSAYAAMFWCCSLLCAGAGCDTLRLSRDVGRDAWLLWIIFGSSLLMAASAAFWTLMVVARNRETIHGVPTRSVLAAYGLLFGSVATLAGGVTFGLTSNHPLRLKAASIFLTGSAVALGSWQKLRRSGWKAPPESAPARPGAGAV